MNLLYKNYNGGWADMQNYKSVAEFLVARRKKLKDKYVADDSWIESTKPSIKSRATLLLSLTKYAIDFPIDEQIDHYNQMIYPEEGSYQSQEQVGGADLSGFPGDDGSEGFSSYTASIPGSVNIDYTLKPDQEGRSNEALNFGNDLTENEESLNLDHKSIQKLIDKYLTPAETGLFGLPDGIDHADFDTEQINETQNPFLGTSDIGTQPYQDKWNI